ncbi:expressed protein [Phakopsora pachyrhizi]|uniref:Expressed protein n=1 Tax=Phakopsora pachyrhizi TaxID=170000 RepID=A0AAV0AT15_PHAPC|nr:expressed protein [Phakopsora pachyrhizi]
MFSLRVFFIIWLTSSVVMLGKGVQAYLHTNLFGEAGEHLSHDSASWNSRDLSDLQPNIHYDVQNHMAHSTYPVGNYHSNQEPEEGFGWEADEIPPQDVWKKHADQTINLEEAMSFDQGNSWNFAQFEDSSFSGQNHQKENYPHAGYSQYQSSSSSTIQPYDADLSDGNYVNSAPHDFWYPDSSFAPQSHQILENSHYNQMTQGPAFHFEQGHLWNSPETISNWGYQNHGTTSSSHNSGITNTGAEINHRRNTIDNESLNAAASKILTEKYTSISIIEMDCYPERVELIEILKNNFRRCTKKDAISRLNFKKPRRDLDYESVHEKALRFIESKKSEAGSQATIADENHSLCDKLKRLLILEYTLGIYWDKSSSLKDILYNFADNFAKNKNVDRHPSNSIRMRRISILGINLMKIIAKKYSEKDISEEFGNDDNLLNYNTLFWEFCFKTHKNMKEDLSIFFQSIAGSLKSKINIEELSSIKFSTHNNADTIFPVMERSIIGTSDKLADYLYSWYYVNFRAMVYYPELIVIGDFVASYHLKRFIESGILYYYEAGEKA